MTDWLQKLDLQGWWKVAIAVGVVILLAALAAGDRGFAVIGLGIIAAGFGEWMNHRMETEILHGGQFTTYERVNRPMGLALEGIGIFLIALGLYLVVTK